MKLDVVIKNQVIMVMLCNIFKKHSLSKNPYKQQKKTII